MGRPAADWRNLLGVTVLLVVVGVGTAPLDLVYLPIQSLVFTLPIGFLAGYLWWQDGIDRGRRRVTGSRPSFWRVNLTFTTIVAVLGIVAVYAVGALGVAVALLSEAYLSFLTGMGYRQDVLRSGSEPRWRFLRIAPSGQGGEDG